MELKIPYYDRSSLRCLCVCVCVCDVLKYTTITIHHTYVKRLNSIIQYLRKMDLSELIEEVYTSTDDEIRETNGKIITSSKLEFYLSSLKKKVK
jgi:hypothetical protein